MRIFLLQLALIVGVFANFSTCYAQAIQVEDKTTSSNANLGASQTTAPEKDAGKPSAGTNFFQGIFQNKLGGADTPITGGVSASVSNNPAPALETCIAPFGTIAVVQPQDQVAVALQKYGLPLPTNLLRLMIQQSNCFAVVERGLAMQNLLQERALSQAGQLQDRSNMGKGQMVTADFILTPEVNFIERNAGGAGLLGALSGILGTVGGKLQEASTSLVLADTRSGLQVAAAEGSVEKADWAAGVFLGGIGAGAYTNTAQGKIVAAALLDNYNNVVKAIRNQATLRATKPSELGKFTPPETIRQSEEKRVAGAPKKDNGDFAVGEVLRGKIPRVRVFAQPSDKSRVIFSLSKTDEVVYMGEEQDGYLKIQASEGAGWVQKLLVLSKAQ